MAVISKYVREKMVATLTTKAFKDKLEEADKECQGLALRLYNLQHTEEQQEIMAQLPDAAFLQVSGYYIYLPSKSSRKYCILPKERPRFCHLNTYWNLSSIQKEFGKEEHDFFNAVLIKYEKTEDDKTALSEELDSIIRGARTYKKLWELWPDSYEALKHLGPSAEGTSNFLPALPTERLNRLIGLPV